MRLSRVLDDGFKSGNLVLDGQYLLQLLAVFNDDDVCLAVDGAVEASLCRIGRVNPRGETTANSKKIKKIKNKTRRIK